MLLFKRKMHLSDSCQLTLLSNAIGTDIILMENFMGFVLKTCTTASLILHVTRCNDCKFNGLVTVYISIYITYSACNVMEHIVYTIHINYI